MFIQTLLYTAVLPAMVQEYSLFFQDGCWGCLDDIQQLREEALATLLDHVQAVYAALRTKQDYCFMNDGQEVRYSFQNPVFFGHNCINLIHSTIFCEKPM